MFLIMRRCKRGVTVVTATILVIVLAILIGILSTNFIKNIPIQPIHCEKHMDIRLMESQQGIKQLCVNEEERIVYFVLRNNGPTRIEGYNILIIGDTKGFAKKGVHVNLYVESEDFPFEINVNAAKESGLAIDYHILKLAKIVETGR